MSITKYKFVKVKELIHKVCDYESPEYPNIGFTFDTPEDLVMRGEPMGWYGVALSPMFDGVTFVIGYWGGGIIVSRNEWDEKECVEDFIRFMWNEQNRIVDEDTLICVDADEYGEEEDA